MREARDNTIKSLNLIHVAKISQTLCVFLGTDAEKAFDRINWPFIFLVLRHAGLGNKMVQWIKSIYTQTSAQVRVNGVLSSLFKVSNRTRQGCPLFPLLFALSVEP